MHDTECGIVKPHPADCIIKEIACIAQLPAYRRDGLSRMSRRPSSPQRSLEVLQGLAKAHYWYMKVNRHS